MAQQHSFDVVSEIDLQEVKNAVTQTMKEVHQRYDFKGSKAEVTLDEKERALDLAAEDDMKLHALSDIMKEKLVKRGISLKALTYKDEQAASGASRRQRVLIQHGIDKDKAKEVVKLIKGSKIRVQAAIQDAQVRITGKSLDDLQSVIELLKGHDFGIHMQFVNYR